VSEPSFDEPDATPPRRTWLLMVALGGLIGLLVGCLASAFRLVVDALVKEREGLFEALAPVSVLGWLGPILLVGISLLAAAELVRRFAPEAGGSGIQEVEGALEGDGRLRWQRVLPVKFLGAAMALGSGAVLGREGPTVRMRGALGTMLSDRFQLTAQNRHILVAAGAAAGLSAAFNAPLAGILFVFEEMRRRFKFHFTSIEAVLVAAAVADLVVLLVTGQGPVIQMLDFPKSPLGALWLFPLFGALFGGFGVAFNGLLLGTLNGIDRLPAVAHRLAPFAIGAGLGALGYWLPDAVGGGYGAIGDALAGRIAGGALLSFFAIRFAATLLSYGSGAPGGIFAPMLALGTLFGMWFGTQAHELAPQLVPHAGVLAVAGMAAFFAATVRAPLTGIALAVAMTGNFDQILPLILTCVAAGLAAQALGGRPIYSQLLERTLRLAPRGES
jgi:CIC family chloride channel protein